MAAAPISKQKHVARHDYLSATAPSSDLVSDLRHLESGVHVLRVADGRDTAEGLHRGPAVEAARAHAHSAVEPVLVHLLAGDDKGVDILKR